MVLSGLKEVELIVRGYRLATAEILFHPREHASILQTHIWQKLDLAPKFPVLKKFLGEWEMEQEIKIHSVKVCHAEMITPAEFRLLGGTITIH